MIEFFFDCSSPWTYLAFHNAQPLARELGVDVRYRPILVGGIFNTINPTVYASRQYPVKAKQDYLRKDLADWARHTGLKILFPPRVFPVNSVKAMRACLALEPRGLLVPFATAVFEAYWGRDEDIADDAVLTRLFQSQGLDAGEMFAAIARPDIKAQLRDNTDELIARGGFGSPTIFVGDDMYFGNDRLHFVREAALAARRSAGAGVLP